MMPDLVVRGRRVVTESGVRPAAIHIVGGVIAGISNEAEIPGAAEVIDAGDRVVLPGLVDTHVHINEPGRAEWEGFATATRAAAAGGVTTLVDMPLNSIPPTTTLAGLEAKRRAARGQVAVDVGFWGGVVDDNAGDLPALIDAGVCGFKCFLVPSGVDEFSHVGEAELRAAMNITGAAGVPLLAHAELAAPIEAAERAVAKHSKLSYLTYLASRPNAAEDEAIALLASLCTETRAPVHIVHHASATSLALIEATKHAGVPLTAETCPHYLHFAAEDIADGATEFKCAPPIRDRDNRGRLWEGLRAGVLDMVVSDHSPCLASLKRQPPPVGDGDGDFLAAWGGIASLGLALPVLWTELQAHETSSDVALQTLVGWLATTPADRAGLARKGRLRVGGDADLVIFDDRQAAPLELTDLRFRNRVCPYLGETLQGRVEMTMLRGEVIYRDGAAVGEPRGALLTRG